MSVTLEMACIYKNHRNWYLCYELVLSQAFGEFQGTDYCDQTEQLDVYSINWY